MPLLWRGPAGWAAFAVFMPIQLQGAVFGNVQPLLVLMLMWAVERRSGPLWIAVGASLKATPLALALVYAGRGEWRRAGWAALFTAVLVVPMLLFDLSAYPTGPGPNQISLAGVSLLLFVPVALVSLIATYTMARTRFGWLAGAVAMLATTPRLLTYQAGYALVGLPIELLAMRPRSERRARRPGRRTAEMTRTAVLGAGALGLTVAFRLAQRGDEVVVIEREPLPGGLAAGFEIEPGMWLDKFYHHLFRRDRHAIGLIDELGLGDELVWPRPLTVTLRDGQVHQLDSPASLLRFRPLPVLDRLRMGAWLAYLQAAAGPGAAGGADRRRLDRAAGWARRATTSSGARCCAASSATLADEIAMPWFWARVHDRTAELGYLRGGFQRLYDRLAERITRAGCATCASAPR